MPPMPPMGPGGRKPGGPHGARLTMEKPKDAKNTLKKLIGYIGRNRYLFFALIGVMLIITLLTLPHRLSSRSLSTALPSPKRKQALTLAHWAKRS